MEVHIIMQEKIRKTLRHIGVLGTTVAMLGATMSGALAAADLSDYPSPFGGKDTVFVVGSGASSDDSDAVSDIFMGLPASKSVGATAGLKAAAPKAAGSASGRYQKLEDLPLTVDFNDTNDGFGTAVDADDVEGFLDTTLDIDIGNVDDDYDVRDELRFSGTGITGTVLRPHTGLTASNVEDDFAERVFVPMVKNSWGYYFVFEDSLKEGNLISNATNREPIQLEFLGKLFELEGAATGTGTDNTRVIMNVGQKFYLNAGDCVVVDGKEVCLVQTASSAATVSVDGVREVISENQDERVNGLEVRIEDVSSDEGVEFDSATLFVGEKSRETFDDGEEFIGEDEDDPAWTWHITNLTSTAPILGIRWSLDLDFPEETDNPLYEHPLYEGESVCLPFDYACIEFDSMQIDDYQDYEIIGGVSEDLYWSPTDADNNLKNVTAERVLELRAKGSNDDGFQCQTSLSDSTLVETDTIQLAVNRSNGALMIFREQQDGSKSILCRTLAGVNNWTEALLADAFRVDYRDTVINVDLAWHIPSVPSNSSGAAYGGEAVAAAGEIGSAIDLLAWNNYSRTNESGFTAPSTGNVGPAYGFIRFLPITRGQNISVYFETDEGSVTNAPAEWNDFEYLGDSDSDTSTAFDVVYGGVLGARKQFNQSTTISATDFLVSGSTDVSGFEENTRAGNGIILLDAEAHQASDRLEMRVPSDLTDFKANIIISTSGSAGAAPSAAPAAASSAPTTRLDTEVTDLGQYNAIVVGGPAVNKASADLMGLSFPTYGSSGSLPFGEGEAVIELKANGEKAALLVSGWESDDTRRAGVVLKNYKDFAASLKGSAVKVTGTSLDVSGITVTAQ